MVEGQSPYAFLHPAVKVKYYLPAATALSILISLCWSTITPLKIFVFWINKYIFALSKWLTGSLLQVLTTYLLIKQVKHYWVSYYSLFLWEIVKETEELSMEKHQKLTVSHSTRNIIYLQRTSRWFHHLFPSPTFIYLIHIFLVPFYLSQLSILTT